jgi:hypothetical protein
MGEENGQMGSTIYKRRPINLDDETYKRGKELARSQKSYPVSAATAPYQRNLQTMSRHYPAAAVDLAEYQREIGTDYRLKGKHRPLSKGERCILEVILSRRLLRLRFLELQRSKFGAWRTSAL